MDAGCLMLTTMLLDLNRDLEHVEASEMIVHPSYRNVSVIGKAREV